MSTHGSVRAKVLLGACVVSLSGIGAALCVAPVCADSDNSRPDAQQAVRTVVQREPIPYPTLRRTSSELRSGTSVTVRTGINGVKQSTYRATYEGPKEIRRELVSTKVLKKPVAEVVAVGRRRELASRGYFAGRKVVVMIATGYSPSAADNGGNSSGRSATGLRVGRGLVAVDPHYIPLGTRLYIEGYGYAVAGDTGGAIKGNRIDLGQDTRHSANAVGRRRVVVHILD